MSTSNKPPCPYNENHGVKMVQISPAGYMCLVCYSTVGIVVNRRGDR